MSDAALCFPLMFSILYCIKFFINKINYYQKKKNSLNNKQMMHYSSSVYESQQARKNNAKNKEKAHAKTNGSYFEAPLVEKTLSTKPLSYRNVFRSVVEENDMNEKNGMNDHFLDLTPMQSTTLKTMNLQKISQDPEVKKAFRRHYRIDIKQYLKRKYRKQAYEIPLQAFEFVRYVDQKQSQPWKTTFVYIYKPFFINDNLKRRIQCDQDWNKEMFKSKALPKLFRQLLKCSIQFGGLDNFIMTTSNVYIEENLETLQINYTSFTGLAMLKCGSRVTPHEYFEILPYFTQHMITQRTIRYQERIRFFLINCLCLLTKKDFVVEAEKQVNAEDSFSYEDVKNKLLGDRHKILKQFKKQIESVKGDKKKKMVQDLKMDKLLMRGLVDGQQLSWHEIVQCICPGKDFGKEEEVQPNAEYGAKIEQTFRNLHKQLFESDPDKQFYIDRNLDSQLLYIPVKFQADLALVFEKKAWWEIFNIRDQKGDKNTHMFNIFHQNFCFRLLSAVLSKYTKGQRNEEWALQFRDDPVLQILFEYLNLCEYPSIIVLNAGEPNETAIMFEELYKKYMSIKGKPQ